MKDAKIIVHPTGKMVINKCNTWKSDTQVVHGWENQTGQEGVLENGKTNGFKDYVLKNFITTMSFFL